MSLSLFSLNARGLKNNVKRKALFLFSKRHKVDFSFFQESHSTSGDARFWRSQWAMRYGYHMGQNILRSRDYEAFILVVVFWETSVDTSGHFLLMVVVVNKFIVIIVTVYGYNSVAENCTFLNMLDPKLSSALRKYPTAFLI